MLPTTFILFVPTTFPNIARPLLSRSCTLEVERNQHPSHWAQTAAGAGCWSLLCSESRCNRDPTLTGTKSLTGAPNMHLQLSGTNGTAGGQIPSHASPYLSAAWPGQAGSHQGQCGALPPQPALSHSPYQGKPNQGQT